LISANLLLLLSTTVTKTVAAEGNEWKKVYSHDTRGGLFANLEEAKKKNVDDENALLYSILYNLEAYRTNQGYFHFKLCYPELTQFPFPCNEWTQTSNPVFESKITDYNPINIIWNKDGINQPFHGIGLSPSSKAYNLIDDAPDHVNWFSSIGTLLNWPGGSSTIPGPRDFKVKKAELYVRYLPSTDSCPVQINTDYPGNDIAYYKANSYQECRALCEEAAGCNAYTYASNYCYLKSSISRTSHHSIAVSGKPCKKSSCPVHLATDYPGNDINLEKKDKRNSSQECRTLCEETAGCNAYSYSPGDKRCYLKSSKSKSRNYGHVISGEPCKKCKPEVCKMPNVLTEDELKKVKEEFMALDKDDKDNYLKKVKELLPDLIQGKVLSPQDIGIAKEVTDQTKYPLALLTGDDVNLVKSESKTELINGSVTKSIGKKDFTWATERITSFYAAPGEFVTVTVPEDLLHKISVEIGHDKYVIKYKKFVQTTQKFASPFGGFLNIRIHDRDATSKKGMFDITVDNAVEAPHFVLGQSTNEDWENMKKTAAPWAVLRVPGQIHIFVDTRKIKKVKDMSSVMSSVKKTMDVYDHMMGIPVGSQPGEERVHYDPYCHYGGYTYDWGGKDGHLCVGAGSNVIHPDFFEEVLKNFGDGIFGHEIGHRGCYPDLPYMGKQWTAEIVRHYLDVTRGFVNWDRWANPFAILNKMVGFKTFSNGRPCYEAYLPSHFPKGIRYEVTKYENCWTVLYRLPLLEFGVDTWRKVLTANAKLSDIKYSNLTVKTERMVDLYCKATKHNLIPFFNFFNIQVSDEVQDSCKAQPMPKILTGYLKVANCLSDDKIPDSECVKMPEFPDHKGLCLISGRCTSDDYDTVMNNTVDIYGNNKTRDTEDACLARAVEIFAKCDNDGSNPITATYVKKDGTSSNNSYPKQGKCFTDSSSCTQNIDCLTSIDGASYIGYKNRTKSGRTCQRWGAQSPHAHCVGRGLEGNYCRNPDGEPTVWCYTTDPGKRWELCDVDLCAPGTNCYHDSPRLLPNYIGSTSTMVPSECNKKCAEKNYSYFGVQYYNECWCGNTAPKADKQSDMSKCNAKCEGDRTLLCGGSMYINIWKVCKDQDCKFAYQ